MFVNALNETLGFFVGKSEFSKAIFIHSFIHSFIHEDAVEYSWLVRVTMQEHVFREMM